MACSADLPKEEEVESPAEAPTVTVAALSGYFTEGSTLKGGISH